MPDLAELVEYVRNHPFEYGRRWQLAKRLYLACEYNDALDHLEVLKEEWHRKLNVVRYLAAAYYRLGQYDDAIRELEGAIKYWPEEIPPREQLARVFEMSGRREQAAETWEGVLELTPRHGIATEAVNRLRSRRAETPKEDLHLSASDSGIDLTPVRTCSNCGAQNNKEFDRCWQCHASLPRSDTVTPTPLPMTRPEPPHSTTPWVWTLVCGLVIVGFVSFGLYLALDALVRPGAAQQGMPPTTVYEVLAGNLLMVRAAVTGVLVIVWPLALWAGVLLARARRPSATRVNMTGILLATGVHVLSWAPVSYLPYAALVPAAVSLALILVAFGIGWGRALGTWAIQGVIVVAVSVGTVTALGGTDLVAGFPAIVRHDAQHRAGYSPTGHPLTDQAMPAVFPLRWSSTGSLWLDEHADRIQIDIDSDPAAPPNSAILRSGAGIVAEAPIANVPFHMVCPVVPDTGYELELKGPEGKLVSVTVHGVLLLEQ